MDLRLTRNALGISQSKLAWLSGVSRFKICSTSLGSGKSKAATLTVALARAIGIDVPDELLEGCE